LAYMHLISWNCILTYFFLSLTKTSFFAHHKPSPHSIRISYQHENEKSRRDLFNFYIYETMLSCSLSGPSRKSIALFGFNARVWTIFTFLIIKFFFGVERERKISRKSSREFGAGVKRREEKFQRLDMYVRKKRCAVSKKCWDRREVLGCIMQHMGEI
jgi:hypothetical protein